MRAPACLQSKLAKAIKKLEKALLYNASPYFQYLATLTQRLALDWTLGFAAVGCLGLDANELLARRIMIDLLEKNESSKGETQRAENKDIKLMLGLGRAIEMVVPSRAYEPKVTAVCKPENAHLSVPTPPPKVA